MTMRKYYFSFIFFILLFHIILVSAAVATNKIMPLGDSITYDDHAADTRTDGERIAYRFRLWQLLNDDSYDFDFVGSQYTGFDIFPDAENEGHPGWTDDEIVNGNTSDPGAGQLADWLATFQPNIVLLHIGTNGLDPSPDDVEAILDEIDASNLNTWVVLARIINRSCSTDLPPCSESGTTMLFNDNIEDMAFDRINNVANPAFPDKIFIVDMEANAGIDYRLQPIGDMIDNLHPIDNGYVKMADSWFSALEQILPLADAGIDQNVNEFEAVTLDASESSDPKDGTLTYQWAQTAGAPIVTLSDDTAVQPTFDAPDAGPTGKTLTFTLTVTDEDELVATDEVNVDVAKIVPQANAGPDQTVNESVTVTLDASNSVGVGLSYQWVQTPITTVTLTGAATATATFTAPNVGSNGETLSFSLTITDDDSLEDTDTVNITVRNRNSSGGGGGGGGGGGCFIATATINSPMTLSGKAPHEPYSEANIMVIWQRLMAGDITLLTPSAGHIETQALVVSMVMLFIFGVANTLRKPRKRWLKL